MREFGITQISRGEILYPVQLSECMGEETPQTLAFIGSPDLLTRPLLALICSVKCPGSAILDAHEAAKKVTRSEWVVVSGFHSPMEKECFRILFRAKRPVIVCPARSLEGLRIPKEWREPIGARRMLLLSPFTTPHSRSTTRMAETRNLLVAAIADRIWIPYVDPGGKTEALADRVVAFDGLMEDVNAMIAF